VAPIRVEGKPFGVVEIYYAEPRPIPAEDVDLLDALSDAAAIALRNATSYARILEQGSELARRNDDLARQKEELARLNDELRRADVLKSQFLSTMSHELRTPLTSIIGFSSILLRGRKGETLSERQRDNATRILSSARHLVTLINDILDLSRIEAGRLDVFRREVDVGELLEALRAGMEPQARDKNLWLRLDVAADLAPINTDADRLRQVLLNLVDNALKFTHQGGVTLRAQRAGDSVLIAVEDTGVGIPASEQERVFDEFYQSDQSSTRTAGGTGLGLAISRRLVTLLGGRLTLSSTPGVGSTFTVVLPATSTAHVLPGSQAAGGAVAAGTNRVLLIDDDPEMMVLLERNLEGSRWQVIGALSADEGVEKAHELRPDAILLDVMMPETDGWRTLHRLKSDPELSRIPVIMHTIVADQALGFSLGATDYLVKPVEREQFLAALDRLAPVDTGPVLVVDDDEDIRNLLATVLSDEGIPVAVAANGMQALDLATARLPRLVILDLMMPELDGFEVLRRLRSDARTRHISVVVVTAKALTAEEERMLSREASTVIVKDAVPLDRLLDEVRGALEAAR
jgi:signal transduction histidine kinase/DNA-binding response OmpR family regulator